MILNNQSHTPIFENHHDINNPNSFNLNPAIQHLQSYNPYQIFQPNNYLSSMMIPPVVSPSSMLPLSNYAPQNNISQIQNFDQNQRNNFCIRFAVNGISKFTKGNVIPANNRHIQYGDFGDDAGMIAENSQCIVIGKHSENLASENFNFN